MKPVVDAFVGVGSKVEAFVIPDGMRVTRAYVTVETAAIRWKYDGGNPSAGVGGGHLASVGETISITTGDHVKAFRMVANTGTPSQVYYSLESA